MNTTTGTAATTATNPLAAAARQPKKQAVVVIHGIGEQRPLETLRSFVETVYQRDPSLTWDNEKSRVDDPILGRVNRVWIVPDNATGTVELRRITTAENHHDVRTDFFEFYWADIMDGTPLELVTGWIRGLLLRSPFNVPHRLQVWIAWVMLWILALAFVAMSIAVLEPTEGIFGAAVAAIAAFLKSIRVVLSIGLAVIGAAILAARVSQVRDVTKLRFGVPLALFVLAGLLFYLLKGDVIGNPKLWAAGFAALVAAVTGGIFVPYIGDIARYARATPSTIAQRAAVRERGLQLLRELHKERDGRGRKVYDRIVIVGHSLGSIIAYDLLQYFWEEIGPIHKRKRPPEPKVQAALQALDGFVRSAWPAENSGAVETPVVLADYQAAQRDVYNALVATDQGWLISDLITVGSPLVHSEFLISDDRDKLIHEFGDRLLSSSPPRPDLPKRSMLYPVENVGPFAHFAAPFAAVKWTNIYDTNWFPLFGDIVSGPLQPIFGSGISDCRVKIKRAGWPGFLGRLCTHTLYWTWPAGAESKAELPEHIRTLREALALAG